LILFWVASRHDLQPVVRQWSLQAPWPRFDKPFDILKNNQWVGVPSRFQMIASAAGLTAQLKSGEQIDDLSIDLAA